MTAPQTDPAASLPSGTASTSISVVYTEKRSLRRYTIGYAIAAAAAQVVLVSGVGILLPNHVQIIEFGSWFTGHDSGVDLQQLSQLKAAVAAGTVVPTTEQTRLIGVLTQFDSARASALALVIAVSTIATMLVQPVLGVISDRTRSRFGRRAPWLVYLSIAAFVGLVGLRFSPSIAVLAIAWTVVSAALNGVLTPMVASIADRVPESRRGTVSSTGAFGGVAGGIIGAIAAGATFALIGINIWLIWAFVAVVGLLLFVLRNPDRSSKDLVLPAFSWGQLLRGFTIPFRSRDFRWVWMARVLLSFGYAASSALSFYALQSYIQPNLSAAQATSLTPLISVAAVPFTIVAVILAGRLSDRVGRRKPFIIVASLIMAASILVLVVWPSVPAVFITTAGGAFGLGVFLPVDQALFIDVLPDTSAAGRDLGLANVAALLGTALAPVLAAQVLAISGGYQWVWIVSALLVALGALAVLPVRRR